MSNTWFRAYAEMRTDPKVRTMPEAYQLRLFWLLCLRCDGPTEKLSADELMFGLSCDSETLRDVSRAFQAKGFIDENWSVLNWNKRQFISDSSTDRVRKYRAKQAVKQSETLPKRDETQNVTDQNRTEQNRTKKEAAALPPFVDASLWADWVEMRRKMPKVPFTDRARDGIISDLHKLREYGIDPNDRLANGIKNGWRGVLFDSDKPKSKVQPAYPAGFFDSPVVSNARN